MTPTLLRRLLLVSLVLVCLALVVLSTGCAHEITGYSNAVRMTQPATETRVTVRVHWEGIEDVAAACDTPRLTYGCAKVTFVGPDVFCNIHMPKPRDFDDEPKLAVLGHEMMHCLGARHE